MADGGRTRDPDARLSSFRMGQLLPSTSSDSGGRGQRTSKGAGEKSARRQAEPSTTGWSRVREVWVCEVAPGTTSWRAGPKRASLTTRVAGSAPPLVSWSGLTPRLQLTGRSHLSASCCHHHDDGLSQAASMVLAELQHSRKSSRGGKSRGGGQGRRESMLGLSVTESGGGECHVVIETW